MKQVVATILSLSVLVAGSALAAPATTAPVAPAPAAVSTAALPPVAGQQGIRPPQPGQVAEATGRHHKGPHGQRRQFGAAPHGAPQADAGRMQRHDGMHRRGGPRQGADAGHRPLRLGAPLAENRQGVVVTEHRRHGLQKAPRGQEWRRIGERYVRVTSGSNVVNEIVINGM